MLQRAQLEGLKTGVLSLGFTLEIWGPQVITQALGASVSPWPPGTADPTSPSEVTRKDMVHQVTADPVRTHVRNTLSLEVGEGNYYWLGKRGADRCVTRVLGQGMRVGAGLHCLDE